MGKVENPELASSANKTEAANCLGVVGYIWEPIVVGTAKGMLDKEEMFLGILDELSHCTEKEWFRRWKLGDHVKGDAKVPTHLEDPG